VNTNHPSTHTPRVAAGWQVSGAQVQSEPGNKGAFGYNPPQAPVQLN